MCGICGSLSLSGDAVDPADVRAMLDTMVHRGPDSGGLFTKPGIAAGVRRLAVIDLDRGDQPMTNEDGSIQVVFNGEIYNYQELREFLAGRGHVLKSRSDTEVLVHLWEEDGPALLERLNGMFAFCIHDARRHETFLARDRVGIKPLYYYRSDTVLAFASELAVLLRHAAVPADVDPVRLIELFCLQYVTGDATLYRGIRKLAPGHAMHFREGALRVYRYYDPPRPAAEGETDLAAAREKLAALLEDSVRLRRVSDVPLGVFLSGGLDSTIVTALLSSMSDQPVRTFSVGFEGQAAFDERSYARQAAERFETEHHALSLSAVDIADYLPRLVSHLAQPVMDPALIPTYLLSEFARRRVTVVLTGEGADELFGGYRRYLYQARYGWLGSLPGVQLAGRGMTGLPRRVRQALDAVGQDDPVRGHLEWSSTIGSKIARELFDEGVYEEWEQGAVEHFRPYFGSEGRLADQLYADQQEWLPHNLLAKVDRASMAFSLEARVPFLDHRLVEWAASLSDGLKIRGSATKFILRETFGEHLPPEIVERPKQGFDLPLAAWIRGPLQPLARDLLAPQSLSRWDGLRPEALSHMLERHLGEEQDFGLPLFNALSVMTFLDRCA